MTSRHLGEIYGVEVGHDLIGRVTDAVLEDVKAWQARPLEEIYPIVFLDALVVKIRDHGVAATSTPTSRSASTATANARPSGSGSSTEGAKFWLQILTELKHRGVGDVLVCCVDGLKGFPEAIEAVWPPGRCADMHRSSDPPQPAVRGLPRQEEVAAELKVIYTAPTAEAASQSSSSSPSAGIQSSQ